MDKPESSNLVYCKIYTQQGERKPNLFDDYSKPKS